MPSAWIERASKGYRARWRVGPGSPKAGPVHPTEAAALAWAVDLGLAERPAHEMGAVIKHWREVRMAERNAAPTYLSEVAERLVLLCSKRNWLTAEAVTIGEVDRWRVDSGGVGDRDLALLLSVLRWSNRRAGVPIDPHLAAYRRPRKPRSVPNADLLSEEDLSEALDRAAEEGPEAACLVSFLATYGARPVTACRLLIGDVHFSDREVIISAKHSGQWRFPITESSARSLAVAAGGRPASDHLFLRPGRCVAWPVDRKGRAAVLSSWYRRVIGQECRRPHSIYDLKRSAITRLLQSGADPATVAHFTGHLDLSQVLRYARSNRESAISALERVAASTQIRTQMHTGVTA